jgi:hypothetical protein
VQEREARLVKSVVRGKFVPNSCICHYLSSDACALCSFTWALGIVVIPAEPYTILTIQEGKGSIRFNFIFFSPGKPKAVTQSEEGSEEWHIGVLALLFTLAW